MTRKQKIDKSKFEQYKNFLNQQLQSLLETQIDEEKFDIEQDNSVLKIYSQPENNLSPMVSESKYPKLRPLIDDLKSNLNL